VMDETGDYLDGQQEQEGDVDLEDTPLDLV
jgi:hypothetical protein